MKKRLPDLTRAEAAILAGLIVAGTTCRMFELERAALIQKGCLLVSGVGKHTVYRVTRWGAEALEAGHPDAIALFRRGHNKVR